MKKIELEIPEGKEVKWVNDVLTLVDEKPIEYKFKVGDKVRNIIIPRLEYIVKERCYTKGKIIYTLKSEFGETILSEEYLELNLQDITERIKTFEDACRWCHENGKGDMVELWYNHDFCEDDDTKDIDAYLKLRIITCALNEGWEPTGQETRCSPYFGPGTGWISHQHSYCLNIPTKLTFKTKELALYAAKQFRDIYADFCGCKKGGEG